MTRFSIFLALVSIALDQLSKFLTEQYLPVHQEVSLLPVLGLFRTYNTGISFSFFAGANSAVLIGITVCIIAFLLWLWRNLEKDRFLSSIGYALILGGAIGNLIDRIWLGKVIDMIYFHIDAIDFHFAVFNLADTFITLGAIAILADEVLHWRKQEQVGDQ